MNETLWQDAQFFWFIHATPSRSRKGRLRAIAVRVVADSGRVACPCAIRMLASRIAAAIDSVRTCIVILPNRRPFLCITPATATLAVSRFSADKQVISQLSLTLSPRLLEVTTTRLRYLIAVRNFHTRT